MEAGGAQGAAIRNANRMREKGIDSSVIFLYLKRSVYSGNSGVQCLLDRPPSGVIDFFIILIRLFHCLRQERPDSVISYTHYANIITGVVARLATVPRIVVSHRNPVHTYPKVCKMTDKAIGFLGAYDVAVCVSDTVLSSFDGYPKRYKRRMRMIRNGIDLASYAGTARAGEELASRKAHGSAFRFVTTGRLHHQKNQRVLFDAMQNVEGAELIIAGDGELRSEYERYIAEKGLKGKIRLIGEIPPHQVRDLLHSCDAFLCPSKYEAFGFSVVEAMAVGKPVICSDIPAMQEVVGEAGILLPFDQPADWAKYMVRLSQDAELRRELSKKATLKAQDYSIDDMVDGYIDAAR
jgi:glycosyltransferase involved in cell wall biosynthesis